MNNNKDPEFSQILDHQILDKSLFANEQERSQVNPERLESLKKMKAMGLK